MKKQLTPMLKALRARIAANDLPPIREGPGWLVYQNDDGERLCANNVVVASPMIEMQLLVRVQPENRLFLFHSFWAGQILEEPAYDQYIAEDVLAAVRHARKQTGIQ